jgi:1-acyl-sn-glycerol-3-phosphate acyltransferase
VTDDQANSTQPARELDAGLPPDHIAPVIGLLPRLRLARRILLCSAVTLTACLFWWAGAVLLLWSRRRRDGWRRVIMRGWCRWICRVLGVRVRVEGTVPAETQFIICNHLSYLDIAVLGGLADTAFVSRADVAQWPVIGWLAQRFDTVFLERSRKRDLPEVNAIIRARLDRGGILLMFPEGTSGSGDSLLPFKSSLLGPAAGGSFAVAAACLRYRTGPDDPPAKNSVCWWGDMEFAPHARTLLSLSQVDATVRFGREARRASDRKQLTAVLEQDVQQMFEPST